MKTLLTITPEQNVAVATNSIIDDTLDLKPELITCTTCKGSGDRPRSKRTNYFISETRVCGTCGGSGKIKNKKITSP